MIERLFFRPRPHLPRHVEDLDERERHGDEAEHQIGHGKVHDEHVPGGRKGKGGGQAQLIALKMS